jgi:hypothetical protein
MSITYTVYTCENAMNDALVESRCQSLRLLVGYDINIYPTHWLITFDRLQDAETLDNYNNRTKI